MTAAVPYPNPQWPNPQWRRRRSGMRWAFLGFGVAIIALGAVLLAVSAFPQAFGLTNRLGFPFFGGFFGIFLVLWGALMLVRIAFWMNRARWSGGPGGPRRFDPAIQDARRRYARGEITREQFEQIIADLRRPPPGSLP